LVLKWCDHGGRCGDHGLWFSNERMKVAVFAWNLRIDFL
jgi:hypothetical protein